MMIRPFSESSGIAPLPKTPPVMNAITTNGRTVRRVRMGQSLRQEAPSVAKRSSNVNASTHFHVHVLPRVAQHLRDHPTINPIPTPLRDPDEQLPQPRIDVRDVGRNRTQ